MRNLVIAVLALLAAMVVTEYNQYSQCREWRVELALRDQGVMPERSWGAAAVDFVAGDLIAIGKKWRCGIEIRRGEAIWGTVEAAALVPVVGSAAVWVARTATRGLSRMTALLREATALRGSASLIRGPMTFLGKFTAQRAVLLFAGGILLAVYFGSGHLLLDALALLPWIVQLAVWAIVFFALGKCLSAALRLVSTVLRAIGIMWRRTARPLLASS
jgi:hypothetical protein